MKVCRSATLLIAAFFSLAAGLAGPAAHAQSSRYLYYPLYVVFGDSISDASETYTASNYICQQYLASNPNGNCYPYPGPTYGYNVGDFTDGTSSTPLAVQYFLVWHQELSYLLPGYTGGPLYVGDEVSYAWAGAHTAGGSFIDNNGPGPVVAEHMDQQVTDFLSNGTYTVSPAYLYVLHGGMEDLLADSSAANATAAAARLTALVQRLAVAGAYNFLIPNLPPLTARPASTAYNNAAVMFNTALAADLATLETQYTIKVTLVDISSLFNNIIANPSAYGFANLTTAANTQGYSTNPDTYLSWDGINPTTAGHYQIAYAACTALTQTVTTVAVSQPTSTTTSPATITATVSTTGTYGPPTTLKVAPTGTVSFYSYTVLLGTEPLVNGTATLSALGLGIGTDHVSAVYSGDANYPSGCPPSPVTLVITSTGVSPTPGNVLTLTPSTITLAPGGLGSTYVSANDGTNTTVYDINCGVVPADLTCSVTNGIIQSQGAGAALVQIFGGTLAKAQPPPLLRHDGRGAIAFALTAPFGLLALAFRRRGRIAGGLLAVLLTVAVATLTSCAAGGSGGGSSGGGGSGGGTPIQYNYPAAGTYTVQVVGTVYATKATTTANLMVVVN